jgi:hypothetical protein
MPEQNVTYIGDGVSVSLEGDQVKLSTGEGENVIYLEPSVIDNLQRWLSLNEGAWRY